MLFPNHVLANADDLGLNQTVNKAIAFCFKNGYINSASLLTNTPGFNEAVAMITKNDYMQNIGVHVNLAGGPPLTNLNDNFLDASGNFNIAKTSRTIAFFNRNEQFALRKEIDSQIIKALDHKIEINHIDSHYHLHTLPSFFYLFLQTAKRFNLKLRLAQTYRDGSYIKFAYRKYINSQVIKHQLHYTDRFETVDHFLKTAAKIADPGTVEIMLHPDFDSDGKLIDHFDNSTIINWLKFIRLINNNNL